MKHGEKEEFLKRKRVSDYATVPATLSPHFQLHVTSDALTTALCLADMVSWSDVCREALREGSVWESVYVGGSLYARPSRTNTGSGLKCVNKGVKYTQSYACWLWLT